jgi:PAS domain S-box-containing protein
VGHGGAPGADSSRRRVEAAARTVLADPEAEVAVVPASFEIMLSTNPVPMWVYDLESLHFLAVNEAAVARYGYSRDQFLALRVTDIRPLEDIAAVEASVRFRSRPISASGPWRHVTADGRLLLTHIVSHEVVWAGRPAALVTSQEITRAPDRLPAAALPHDVLTSGEPALERNLAGELERLGHSGERVAAIAVELLHVDYVEALAGVAGAHAVVEELARRLTGISGMPERVVRLDGRRLAVACTMAGETEVLALAVAAIDEMQRPVDLGAVGEVTLGAVAAVRVADPEEADAGQLTSDVLVALRVASQSGRPGRLVVFEERMRGAAVERLDIEGALRRALRDDDLALHYQPIVDLGSLEVGGYEALLRWHRPGHGWANPAAVVEVAEASGLIGALGAWVRHRAVAETAAHLRSSPRPLTMALNLSAHELGRATLAAEIATLCEEAALDPAALCFELTESSFLSSTDDPARYEQILALEATGVSLAVDDFGTGYSALSYLKHLPVDIVKVDRSFVAGVDVSRADRALVDAITRMSHALGLQVVAEGVETRSQLEVLRDLDVDHAQGYLFARPMAWPDAVGATVTP